MDREGVSQNKTEKKKKKGSLLNYISTYDGHARLIKNAIHKAWYILQKDTKYGKLFIQQPRFIYRKGKSIGNHLVRLDIAPKKIGDLRSQYTDKRGTHPCLNFQKCTSIINGATITDPMKGHEIPDKGFHTCNSHNVVYRLKCPCG